MLIHTRNVLLENLVVLSVIAFFKRLVMDEELQCYVIGCFCNEVCYVTECPIFVGK